MKRYNELRGKHFGETAFLFGAGPSLYEIYKSKYFHTIFNHVVISVNSSIILMPWSGANHEASKSYWISNDSRCMRWSWWEKVKNSHCIKIVRDSWEPFEKELLGFYKFSPRPTSEGVIRKEDEGLAYCSSIPTAIDLAIQMGCKKILLLGVDHKKIKGIEHFWQYLSPKPTYTKNPQDSWAYRQSIFDTYNKMAFKALNNFAKENDANIYNITGSYGSNVKEFENIFYLNYFNSHEE